jgi:hypothetical protein
MHHHDDDSPPVIPQVVSYHVWFSVTGEPEHPRAYNLEFLCRASTLLTMPLLMMQTVAFTWSTQRIILWVSFDQPDAFSRTVTDIMNRGL